VLDIGCGTGILSIFAARAGAKHVYAIDNAEIAEYAREIVRKNNFSEVITVIKGKVEEVELPVEKVDVIISEWMGYFLLYESMLDTIIFARDKWLVPNGLIMPDRFHINIVGFQDINYFKAGKESFWSDVYGIDMSCLGRLVYVEPLVEGLDPQQIVTTASRIFSIDLRKCRKEDSEFANLYSLEVTKDKAKIDGICAWFEAEFAGGLAKEVTFSTGPMSTSTHWKQTIFHIDGEYDLEKGDELYGTIAVRKNKKHPRELDVKFSFNCRDQEGVNFSEPYV
jgi:protein arginine N-methyltransferase 1